MNVSLNLKSKTCVVKWEKGDHRIGSGGWSSPESLLLHRVKKELIKQGHDVIKKRVWKDGNLVDDRQQWVRTRSWGKKDEGEFAVYNENYAIYDAGTEFDANKMVILSVLCGDEVD